MGARSKLLASGKKYSLSLSYGTGYSPIRLLETYGKYGYVTLEDQCGHNSCDPEGTDPSVVKALIDVILIEPQTQVYSGGSVVDGKLLNRNTVPGEALLIFDIYLRTAGQPRSTGVWLWTVKIDAAADVSVFANWTVISGIYKPADWNTDMIPHMVGYGYNWKFNKATYQSISGETGSLDFALTVRSIPRGIQDADPLPSSLTETNHTAT